MKKRGAIVFHCLVVMLFILLIGGCTNTTQYTQSEDDKEIAPSVDQRDSSPQDTLLVKEEKTKEKNNGVLVQIRDNFAFEPQKITISIGTEVSWKIQDNIQEPLRISSPLFESSQLKNNDVFSYTFTQTGTYTIEILNKGKTMQVEVV